jgi:homocysteine S-methyltransferase
MAIRQSFSEALDRDRPILIDGGLATQLEAQGCDIGNVLWSASLLQTNPDAIVRATRAYLDAGAECVATATYQASREGFAKLGLTGDEANALMSMSVDLAALARDEYLTANPNLEYVPFIAASIGPYGAMLHDGSEYRGKYGVSAATLREFHQARLELFDKSEADVLALETIPSRLEAEPVKSIIAYPNSGEVYCVDENSWSGTVTPGDCAAAALAWVDAGATIVGGCCRMGPDHIRGMRDVLAN